MCTQSAAPRTTIDALPPALVLSILERLPRLVDRVRCTPVCKRWAALLDDPAFWSRLDFEGASREHLSSATLMGLVRRSAGRLLSLDISARCCDHMKLYPRHGEPLLEAMAAEGLTGRLESFSAPRLYDALQSVKEARSLRAACPALATVAVEVHGDWTDARAILRALSVDDGRLSLVLFPTDLAIGVLRQVREQADHGGADDAIGIVCDMLAEFATAFAEALACARAKSIRFSALDDFDDYFSLFQAAASGSSNTGRDQGAAAQQLAAVLASPRTGPRELSSEEDRIVGWFGPCPPLRSCAVRSRPSRRSASSLSGAGG